MSDTDTTTEPASSKEDNMAAMRQQLDAARSELAELRELKAEKAIREAGFDPDSGEGKALARIVGGETDTAKIREQAAEFGWTPQPTLTPEEAATVAASKAQDGLRGVATPDVPAQDIDLQIQEARERGDWETAVVLENRKKDAAGAR